MDALAAALLAVKSLQHATRIGSINDKTTQPTLSMVCGDFALFLKILGGS